MKFTSKKNKSKIEIKGKRIYAINPLISEDDIANFITQLKIHKIKKEQKNEKNMTEKSNEEQKTEDGLDSKSKIQQNTPSGKSKETLSKIELTLEPGTIRGGLDSVEEIQLSSLNITPWGFSIFVPCILRTPNLKVLNLANNNLTDDCAVILAHCLEYLPLLRSINVANNKLKGEGAIKLMEFFFKNILLEPKTTNYKNNIITKIRKSSSLNEYILNYHNSMETENEPIYEIDLSDNYLSTEFILKFGVLLENNKKKNLFLRNIGISDVGISNIFKRCKYVEKLDLSQNTISADLFSQYCMSLFSVQTNLKELYLNNICGNFNNTIKTKMGNEILIELLNHLYTAKNLSVFSFVNNKIDDAGFKHFCAFLNKNKNNKLTEIHFSDNNITRIDYLNESQHKNGKLKVINMSNNKITDSSIKLFCEVTLSTNLNICELNLSNNNLHNESCKYISNALIDQMKKVQEFNIIKKEENHESYSSVDTYMSNMTCNNEEVIKEIEKCVNEEEINEGSNFTYKINYSKNSKVLQPYSNLKNDINIHPENKKNNHSMSSFEMENYKYTSDEALKKKQIKKVIINRHCEENDFFSCINKLEFNRATEISKKLHLQYLRRTYIYNVNEHCYESYKNCSLNCFKGLKLLDLSGTCLNSEGINFLLKALKSSYVSLEFLDVSCCTDLNESVYQTLSNVALRKKLKFLKNKTSYFKHLPLAIRGAPPSTIHLDDSEDEPYHSSIESDWWHDINNSE